MNILAINQFNITPQKIRDNNITMPRFGLRLAQPLQRNTVTFGSSPTVKHLASKAKGTGIPMRDAINAHLRAVEIQPEIKDYFVKLFESITVSKSRPQNPVEEVRGRAKGALSIWEKAKTRGWRTLDEVFLNMTDLNGVKCVLRDGSPKGVRRALRALLAGIESKVIILEELEVKRPSAARGLKQNKDKYDYERSDGIKKFVKEAEKAMNGKKVDLKEACYTDSNYPAIHFLFRFAGQRRMIELQMMGHDVSVYKALDDLFFKILNNKAVEDEFAPIRMLIEPLKDEKHAAYLEKFNKYRADSFLFQREKEPALTDERGAEYFMPLKYNIPYQDIISPKFYKKLVDEYGIVGNPYDFNNIYRIYKICRPKADAARERLQAEKDALRVKKKK